MTLSIEIDAFAEARHARPPSRLGQRYSEIAFLPDPGNTIVCHLDQTDPSHLAVLKARARLQSVSEAHRLLFTPESSLHMTLFDGVMDTRRVRDAWPDYAEMDASVARMTDEFLRRLGRFTALRAFQVRVCGMSPNGLLLEGATPEDETIMRSWRDALSDQLGFRRDDHLTYQFHMTFAYMIDWIPDDLVEHWRSEMGDIVEDLIANAPMIPLRGPAFCSFADMTHFDELLPLAK